MDIKLSDAELIIMQILWKEGETRAIDLADKANDERGWEKNTTYTLIQRLIKKGALKRTEPGFYCIPLIDKETVRKKESKILLDKLFNGSLNLFTRAFLEENELSEEELEELRNIINKK